jgi:hypothetical protein
MKGQFATVQCSRMLRIDVEAGKGVVVEDERLVRLP